MWIRWSYIEKHTNDSDDLFFVVVVKHFAYKLNNVKGVVAKVDQSKVMVTENPKSCDCVVGHLIIDSAVFS